jgi:hypothetical protein
MHQASQIKTCNRIKLLKFAIARIRTESTDFDRQRETTLHFHCKLRFITGLTFAIV